MVRESRTEFQDCHLPAIYPKFCPALGLQYPYLKGLVHMLWPNLEAARPGKGDENGRVGGGSFKFVITMGVC